MLHETETKKKRESMRTCANNRGPFKSIYVRHSLVNINQILCFIKTITHYICLFVWEICFHRFIVSGVMERWIEGIILLSDFKSSLLLRNNKSLSLENRQFRIKFQLNVNLNASLNRFKKNDPEPWKCAKIQIDR